MFRAARWLPVLSLLIALCGPAAHAQAGSVINAASCQQTDVKAVINGPTHVAADGDTINIPAGTCTWTAGITVPGGIGITIIGSGTPNSDPSTHVAATPGTIIRDSLTGGAHLFTASPMFGNSTMRISMMEIAATAPSTGYGQPIYIIGTCTASGCPNLRLDNLTVPSSTGSCSISDGTFAVVGNMFGVADHNTVGDTNPGCFAWDFINVGHGNWMGVGHWGDNSWASADTFGTSQAFYLENNTFSYAFGTDADFYESSGNFGGGRFVCRFNTFNNLQGNTACTNHGTDTGGRLRGGRQLEFYDNTATCPSTCNAIEGWRSGGAILFGNSFTGTSNNYVAIDTDRRWRLDSPWVYCDGNNPFDTDDGTTYVSGLTISSNSVINGDQYVITSSGSPGWTVNQWASVSGAPYSFVDLTRHFSFEIASNTANTITAFISCPGNGCSEAPTNGDSYAVKRATVCLDQSGRGPGLLVKGGDGTGFPTDGFPGPVLVSTGAPGPVNEVLDPVYEMNDSGGTVTGPKITSNDSQGLTANRDFYSESVGQGAQTSPTSPFNGTSGTGHGTLARTPSTCTQGVGYLATDQGNWNQSGSGGQGVLFVCTSTNTWTQSYEPYTYPHPLISGGTTGTGPNPPTNVTVTVQ